MIFYDSQSFHRLNHRLDDPDMETEAEALNGEATDSRKMEVQIGGAVTLECDGGCWGHGPGMDPVGGPGPLALSRVVYQEAGEYRCVAPDRKMQDTWRAQLPYHIKVTGKLLPRAWLLLSVRILKIRFSSDDILIRLWYGRCLVYYLFKYE